MMTEGPSDNGPDDPSMVDPQNVFPFLTVAPPEITVPDAGKPKNLVAMQGVDELLQRAVDKTKEGEIIAAAIILVDADNQVTTGFVHFQSPAGNILYGMERIKRKMME